MAWVTYLECILSGCKLSKGLQQQKGHQLNDDTAMLTVCWACCPGSTCTPFTCAHSDTRDAAGCPLRPAPTKPDERPDTYQTRGPAIRFIHKRNFRHGIFSKELHDIFF
jgi:hypothetical protein